MIHIIGGYARAGTALIRQLVDAGTLSNLPGGLKSRGLRVKGDDTPIAPGEFRDVDVPSGNIKDNIMMLPYKEPSQTLLALLQRITDEGRRLGAISDMNVSDMSANAPVGTTLALLERQLKPMAAVQSRVHYAMKLEFKLLKGIIAEYAPEDYQYEPDSGLARARKDDYAMVDVIPVSDPNSSTMAQRVVQYQAAFQMAQSAPQIYDLPYLHRQMIEVLGIKNADKMIPGSKDQKPRDPVSENMSILVGKPAQGQAQQQAQEPMFQLQQAEVQIKQSEVQRKQQKDQNDKQIAAAKLQLDAQRVQIEAQKEGARLQSQEKQSSARLNTQERQQQAKLKLDALKMLATPKQPRQPGQKG